ncbi:MAG TPA: hypothetical protein PKH24_08025 [Sedimentisphaerales bacterium]|jgi:hypothetical protein|nr:hypothetical protein [Sedimentisphaerales bacterium]HNU29287.1 hypothetical protein [Sedimentisphaerales bacterium]
MKPNEDNGILSEAVERLKRDALSQQVPKAVVEETVRRLADAQADEVNPTDARQIPIGRAVRLVLASAALIAVGCIIGRLSKPASVNIDKLCEALVPSVAASIEPALRARVVDDIEQRYQLALAATYVKVKEELTEQYRDELNRRAIQTLAASNATTNRRLAQLVESIDTAQTEDLNRIAQALSEIERKRIQDKAQFAEGMYRLAGRTEETRRFVRLLVDVLPENLDEQRDQSIENPNERTDP